MKMKGNKKVWLTSFLAAAFTLFGAGVVAINSVDAAADNAVTAESVGLVMDKGAGVRLGTADGNNGIRFVLTMDKSEYTALMDKVGTEEGDLYSEVSFGMIITKASYVSDEKELSVENLFTSEAVFEWKPDGAGEDWTVSDGKSLVVNQTFGYLGTSEYYENEYVGFASLVNLYDYNLTQEFIGRGYMKYTAKDGTVNYRMADYYDNIRLNNVRSMTYVAQKAAEDPEMSEYVETLNSLYINHSTVQGETVDVAVNHHKVDVHGEETVETDTLSGQKIGATATATPLTDEAWIYDASRSTASGVVYANNKTTLDLYYDQNPETVYDWWCVGGGAAIEHTFTLDQAATGGIQYEQVAVEFKLDLLEGTMPRFKFYALTAGGAQITDPAENGWITAADYYNEETDTYTFTTTFKWASASWDVGKIWLLAEDGSYSLGVDIVSVEVLSDYDVKINRALETAYTLPEALTGAVRYDKARLTLSIDEVIGDLTEIHIQLKNKAGTTIANNNNAYFTLADCATGEENTYAFELSFPWANGDWDVTQIVFSERSATFVAGINVIDLEVVPAEYDVRINRARETVYNLPEAATGAVQNDKAVVTLELIELAGDLTKIHIQLKNTAGTTIANNDNAYFTLADCATGEANIYAFELSFPWNNGDWDVTQIVLSVDSTAYVVGVNVKSVDIVPTVTYDFEINKALETAYTLPEAVTGAVRYDKAIVTLELVEIEGGLTQIHIQLKNAAGTTIANNDNAYFTLADCETGEANTYAFELTFPWGSGDWDVTQIVLSEKTADYQVGVNVKSIEIVPVEYDFEMNKVTTYTHALASEVAGALRYDKAVVTLEIAELFGDLTKVKLELLNTALVDPVIANNGGAYYTLADCATGEANTYAFTISFPWGSGDWTVRSIRLTVDGASYMLGVNVKSVEILPTAYDFKMNKVSTYTYNLPETITGAVRYDKAAITLELTEIISDLTKIKIELLNASGATIANNDGKYYTLADCATGASKTYQFVISFPWAGGDWDITAIKVTLDGTSYVVGVNVKAIEIQEVAYQLEYNFASGSQAKVLSFSKVAGGTQNGYVKLTFDVAVFYGTLTNIQFNLCTDTAGATTVANSNKAWAEDGTKITSSGGQISMSSLTGKKTVTIVTTFPWANGNWDLQSIRLQLYGTNVQAGVSNLQVELMPDFVPAA